MLTRAWMGQFVPGKFVAAELKEAVVAEADRIIRLRAKRHQLDCELARCRDSALRQHELVVQAVNMYRGTRFLPHRIVTAKGVVAADENGWFNKYGGFERTSLKVKLLRTCGCELTTVRSISCASKRGNWFESAAFELLGEQPRKGMMHLRINQYHDVAMVSNDGGVRVWRRTFLGRFVDFAAETRHRGKQVAFHAETVAEAISGLANKIRTAGRLAAINRLARMRAGRIAASANIPELDGVAVGDALVDRMGFCRPGTRDALNRIGVSWNASISDAIVGVSMADKADLAYVRKTYPVEVAAVEALVAVGFRSMDLAGAAA